MGRNLCGNLGVGDEEEGEGVTKMREHLEVELELMRALGGEVAALMSFGERVVVLIARGTLRREKDVKDMFLYVVIGERALLKGRSSN